MPQLGALHKNLIETHTNLVKQKRTVNGRKLFAFYVFTLSFLFTSAQDKLAYDSAYNNIYKQLAQVDLEKALIAADSLYTISSEPIYKIRSQILIASLYQQKENLEKSIEYAERAEALAEENNIYDWQARADGMLAGQFRMMGLYEKAKFYSNKALKIIPKITDPEKANHTAGLMLQELAFTSMEEQKYSQAVVYLNEAGKNFNKVISNKDFIIMTNERLLGLNYFNLNNYDLAMAHYQSALKLSKTQPTHYITGMINKGIAETLLKTNKIVEAKPYLDKAEKIADQSGYLQLKEAVYEVSKSYYTAIKDDEKLALAIEKKDSATTEILEKKADLLNKTYEKLENRGLVAEKESSNKTTLLLISIAALIMGAAFFLRFKRNKQTELQQFKTIIADNNKRKSFDEKALFNEIDIERDHQQELEAIEPQAITTGNEPLVEEIQEKNLISVETEQILLEKLNAFEHQLLYLDNSLSLSSLATAINTNTKYLSHIIKKYKASDFSQYTNSLRIDYVIDKLTKDEKWRQYKISALAEAAGFSSHSQFAAVFKSLKGLPPSVFIRLLNEGDKK